MTTHLRIPAVTPTVQVVADGSSRTFEFPFPIFTAADLEVFVGDTLTGAGFTVRGTGSSDGGAVTFAAAPAAGQRVTIRRRQTYARTDDFLDERAPTPHELNDAVDETVAALQELADESALTVKRSATADLSAAVDLTLPEPQAGKVLGWNGSANGLVNLTQVDVSDMLHKSQNLADLPDKAQARINLGLGSAATHAESDFATATQGAKADTALQASVIGVSVEAHSANLDWVSANLSDAGKALIDDADAAAQRATLGLATVAATGAYDDLSGKPALGSAAAHADTDFATAAQGAKADTALQASDVGSTVEAHSANLDWVSANLSDAGKALLDDADPSAQRTTLGLGTAATRDVGIAANQVVQLDASGKLPAVDGSALTNLNASALTSGIVSTARLGSGTADTSSFLRGDGAWTALSAISGGGLFSNVQTFRASGTFTVPADVTTVLVMAVGGGGGGGDNDHIGGTGGQSSFGSMLFAPGGGGGFSGIYGTVNYGPGTNPGYVAGSNVIGLGTNQNSSGTYGLGGPRGGGGGGYYGGNGDNGSVAFGLCSVTAGQVISVTVGNGGVTYGSPAQPGAVVVRY